MQQDSATLIYDLKTMKVKKNRAVIQNSTVLRLKKRTYNLGLIVLEIFPAPRSMLEMPTQSMHTNFYPNIEKGWGGGGNFSHHLRPRL